MADPFPQAKEVDSSAAALTLARIEKDALNVRLIESFLCEETVSALH